MGGIIGSVLAAAGDAGVQSMNQNIAQMNQQDLDKQRSDLEMAKAKAIIDYQKQATIDAANQQRQEQASRINAALPGVVLSQVGAAYAEHDAAVNGAPTSGTPLTPEQSAVLQQTAPAVAASKSAMESQLAADPSNYARAAMLTGDISPNTIAQMANTDAAAKRAEALEAVREAHADSMELQRQKFQAGENQKNRQATADLRNDDPVFVKELKALYPNKGPDYEEALRQRINKESGINAAGGGGRSVVYNGRIVASGNEVAAALRNITALPVTANAGFMGFGKPESSGIFNAGVAALKNDLNPNQIKDYNTMWTGVSRNLGTLETSGLATTGSLIASIDKLAFVPGDNGYNALRKLAEVRQIVDAALEPKLADPAVPPDQKKYIQGIMDKVSAAVPYTHADLTKFSQDQQSNPDLTFSQFAQKTLGTKLPQPPIKVPEGISPALQNEAGLHNSFAPSSGAVLNYDPQTGTFH